MKAIITVDVPEHQIGQEVSVHFKDTMCVKGKCEAEIDVLAKHDEEVIKETVASIWGKPPYTEMLDEIRTEISKYGSLWVAYTITDKTNEGIEKLVSDVLKQAKKQVLEIIDKYRK